MRQPRPFDCNKGMRTKTPTCYIRRLLLSGALLCLSGCVRAGFDLPAPRPDAALDAGGRDAGGRDAGTQTARDTIDGLAVDTVADPFGAFTAPQPVVQLNTAGQEDDPTLSDDMLEIYFERDGDIHVASRASVAAPWLTAQPVTAVNTDAVETSVELTVDGLSLWFSREPTTGTADIYLATRASTTQPWGSPQPVDSLNSTSAEWPGALSSDSLRIFITSSRDAGDNIYESTRTTPFSTWGVPIAVASLNSTALDSAPWTNAGATLVYLDSRRGQGDRNIWVAARADLNSVFSTPVMVKGVNEPTSNETDPWLSADLTTLYFTSDRHGSLDLFVARRASP